MKRKVVSGGGGAVGGEPKKRAVVGCVAAAITTVVFTSFAALLASNAVVPLSAERATELLPVAYHVDSCCAPAGHAAREEQQGQQRRGRGRPPNTAYSPRQTLPVAAPEKSRAKVKRTKAAIVNAAAEDQQEMEVQEYVREAQPPAVAHGADAHARLHEGEDSLVENVVLVSHSGRYCTFVVGDPSARRRAPGGLDWTTVQVHDGLDKRAMFCSVCQKDDSSAWESAALGSLLGELKMARRSLLAMHLTRSVVCS